MCHFAPTLIWLTNLRLVQIIVWITTAVLKLGSPNSLSQWIICACLYSSMPFWPGSQYSILPQRSVVLLQYTMLPLSLLDYTWIKLIIANIYILCWTLIQYNRKFNSGDKTVVRSSYLHNGNSYTGKISSLYWIGALISIKMVWKYGKSAFVYKFDLDMSRRTGRWWKSCGRNNRLAPSMPFPKHPVFPLAPMFHLPRLPLRIS